MEKSTFQKRLKKIFHPALWRWIFLLAIIIFFHSSHFLDSDEGVILDGAWNLINGKILYQDFFEFIPPGSFYFIFVIWKIFGMSYLSAKIASLVILILGCTGIYQIARRFTNNATLAYLPALFFAISSSGWPVINHNLYGTVTIIWLSYFFLKAITDNRAINFFWSGILSGIAFLFLQQKSIVVIIAIFIFIIFDYFYSRQTKDNSIKVFTTRKNVFIFIIGFILPVLWLLKWPTATILFSLYEFPVYHYLATNRLSLWLFFIFTLHFLITFSFLNKKNRIIYFLSILQLTLLGSSLSRPDYQHLSQNYFPFYILVIVAITQISATNRLKDIQYRAVIVSFTSIMIVICGNTYNNFKYNTFETIANHPIFNIIDQKCQSPFIYAGPFLPGIYFETRKLNATSYPILITNQQTEQQFNHARQQLEYNQPDCVVLNYKLPATINHNKINPVDELVLNHYHKIYEQSDIILYKINP